MASFEKTLSKAVESLRMGQGANAGGNLGSATGAGASSLDAAMT